MENDRSSRQAANLARHLNQSYPDTVLFLAHHAADRPGATDAYLTGVSADGLDLVVRTDKGTESLRLPLPDVVGGDGDVRSRVRELLRRSRDGAPDAPLTSLEEQTDGAAEHGHGHRRPGSVS